MVYNAERFCIGLGKPYNTKMQTEKVKGSRNEFKWIVSRSTQDDKVTIVMQ